MQEVIAHRGKTNRNADCTPGYYNFEGEFNRRQDGNYNGGFAAVLSTTCRRSAASWRSTSYSRRDEGWEPSDELGPAFLGLTTRMR